MLTAAVVHHYLLEQVVSSLQAEMMEMKANEKQKGNKSAKLY